MLSQRRFIASVLVFAPIFVAQAAGVELTAGQQITMLLTLMLTSKGVAGVPRASLVILAGTLASYGLPLEGVTLILGVDELSASATLVPQVKRAVQSLAIPECRELVEVALNLDTASEILARCLELADKRYGDLLG